MNWSKHRVILIIFVGIIAGELFLQSTLDIPSIVPISLGLIYIIILSLGSYFVSLSYYLPIKNSLESKKSKIIALSFDDGPNMESTDKLLQILDKHDVKASFFCIGRNIEENNNLAERIFNEGHIIGNHSYSHSNRFALSGYKKVRDEISRTNKLIEDITHVKNVYFRPPFGVTNPIIARVVNGLGMTTIGWSLRSYDTISSKEKLISKLKLKTKDNDIILLHDMEQNLVAVDEFINYAKQQGFKFELIEV